MCWRSMRRYLSAQLRILVLDDWVMVGQFTGNDSRGAALWDWTLCQRSFSLRRK